MLEEDACIIAYLEARRDMQSWSDAEWNAATAIIDWLRAQFEEIARRDK